MVRITVTPRKRRAICSVLPVQWSAITPMRSGTPVWASSAFEHVADRGLLIVRRDQDHHLGRPAARRPVADVMYDPGYRPPRLPGPDRRADQHRSRSGPDHVAGARSA